MSVIFLGAEAKGVAGGVAVDGGVMAGAAGMGRRARAGGEAAWWVKKSSISLISSVVLENEGSGGFDEAEAGLDTGVGGAMGAGLGARTGLETGVDGWGVVGFSKSLIILRA